MMAEKMEMVLPCFPASPTNPLRLQEPANSPFLGEVYFLINGYTFSGAAGVRG
jgi:hypothetical protein